MPPRSAVCLAFFFSSRRRHTRFSRDWSSDVCSSDLSGGEQWTGVSYWLIPAGVLAGLLAAVFGFADWTKIPSGTRAKRIGEIGRASCRERRESAAGELSLHKKHVR